MITCQSLHLLSLLSGALQNRHPDGKKILVLAKTHAMPNVN